ncbi:efflux RND transporter periplasmic adaptor subunit [Actinoplanes couchii]|uniref:efflux RND transporter periplasmic adaptor subunit n=1 Tax=Actinoplanes couchii TaxID=403638 RepID=UPI001941CA66|nr:efflux RND transporter periplasmic adaptor subunit [Actinoplanes couchii]MDR6317040.1 hypothetical protein [Actinoplanes couchii]
MDLQDERTVTGTLGFGPARPVKGTGAGILTRLPAVGAKVARGTVLYRVNDQPVPVFYGATPLFRTIGTAGLEGRDVAQVRRNLTALGYRTRSSRPDVSDSGLLDALARWRKDHKLPGTGLAPGQVVILSGPGRVSAVTAAPGDPVDGPILSITGTDPVVSVPMSPADAAGLSIGTEVTVTSPDGAEVPGEVSASSDSSDAASDEAGKVTVVVRTEKPIAGYAGSAAQVHITTIAREGVLAVPVGALVALAEGGYALQLADGSLVAAQTGAFAGGMVQVSGDGITEGLSVVTTS